VIILLKGDLMSLNCFIDNIATSFGEEACVINFSDRLSFVDVINRLDSEINEDTIVITFNNVGLGLLNKGENYWIKKQVQLINILVDHPGYYLDIISTHLAENLYYVCIDYYHTLFLQNIFSEFKDNFLFMPHGGIKIYQNEDKERYIDILYVGNCGEPRNNEMLKGLPKFVEIISNYYETNDYPEAYKALNYYANEMRIELPKNLIKTLIPYVLEVESNITAKRRIVLIEELCKSGYKVTVAGEGVWQQIAKKYPNNLSWLGMLTPEECVERISQTKILINDSPFFSYGAHERIFNGMLNGAVVLTNPSAYLEQRFKEWRDILYWDGRNTDEAIRVIGDVLSDEEFRKCIVNSAVIKAQYDSWGERLYNILNLIPR